MKVKFNWGAEKGNLHVFQVFPGPKLPSGSFHFLLSKPGHQSQSTQPFCAKWSHYLHICSLLLSSVLSEPKSYGGIRPHSNLLRATPAWWQLVIALGAQVGTCHLLEGCQYCCQGSLPPTLCWGGGVRPAQVGAYIGVGVACQNHGEWPETRKHWN